MYGLRYCDMMVCIVAVAASITCCFQARNVVVSSVGHHSCDVGDFCDELRCKREVRGRAKRVACAWCVGCVGDGRLFLRTRSRVGRISSYMIIASCGLLIYVLRPQFAAAHVRLILFTGGVLFTDASVRACYWIGREGCEMKWYT